MTTKTTKARHGWFLRWDRKEILLGVGERDGDALWTRLDPREALALGYAMVQFANDHLSRKAR